MGALGILAVMVLMVVSSGCTWFTAVLCCTPLLTLLTLPSLPRLLQVPWWLLIMAAVLIAAAGAAAIGISLPLAHQYDGHPVLGPALLHAWCAAGVMSLGIAGCARLAQRWRSWWMLVPGTVVMGAMASLLMALPAFFPLPITGSDYRHVIDISLRTEVSLQLRDGAVLAGRLYSPHGPSKGLVVFTHGFGGWKEAWLNHIRLFVEDGWSVLAYDMRGHGRSSTGACTYGPREADDLAQVWTWARTQYPARIMVAYGVSLGGSVTLLAASRLTGCSLVVVESAFADLGELARTRLSWPLHVMGGIIAACLGAGDLDQVRPGACALPPAADLVVGWIADDQVIPATQTRQVATSHPGARVLEMPHGTHLDLITYEPWREFVRMALARALHRD